MNPSLSTRCRLSLLLAIVTLLVACQREPASGDSVVTPAEMPAVSGLPAVTIAARNDLASRLGIEADAVEILETRSVYWRSAALGCPDPERSYAQVLTPGWFIRLAVKRAEYRYHAGENGEPFTCNPRRAQAPLEYAVD